jgi:hypothetical protein
MCHLRLFLSSIGCDGITERIDLYHQFKSCPKRQHYLTKKNYNMKKVTTILTAMILLFSVTAFASEGEKVTAKVKLAFEKM